MKKIRKAIVFFSLLTSLGMAESKQPAYGEIQLDIYRCFDNPIKIYIRYSPSDEVAHLSAEIFKSERSGSMKKEIIHGVEKEISIETFSDIYSAISELNFDELFNTGDASGLDGDTWQLTISKGFSSKSISFWAPTSNTEKRDLSGFFELCKQIVELSELNIPKDRLY